MAGQLLSGHSFAATTRRHSTHVVSSLEQPASLLVLPLLPWVPGLSLECRTAATAHCRSYSYLLYQVLQLAFTSSCFIVQFMLIPRYIPQADLFRSSSKEGKSLFVWDNFLWTFKERSIFQPQQIFNCILEKYITLEFICSTCMLAAILLLTSDIGYSQCHEGVHW